ncbi:MAG TPA: helix-turn-helix transcriptional regulator [Falsiroseomonas sp.]|nr:helix-turn-helix transcriptional regulator [Falsiroseomonas sp.]
MDAVLDVADRLDATMTVMAAREAARTLLPGLELPWLRHACAAAVGAHPAAQRVLALAEADLAAPMPRLTRRENECLLGLVAGLRSDSIAEKLGLARVTVDLHLRRARKRLGAKTREQAVAKAVILGLLRP